MEICCRRCCHCQQLESKLIFRALSLPFNLLSLPVLAFSLFLEDEDDMEVSSRFGNGKTNGTDLDVLEQQVNQIRQSLESHDERANTSFANGDVTMTEPSQKIISHVPSRGGKGPKGRRVGSEGDTDTDDDDSHREVRRGDYKSSSRTQMTDDESYIQTDDDTIRTDDEDMEWQEAIKRWVNR